MARRYLPPGFRFHPTDVELIMYYLKRKVMGKKFHLFEAIAELNIYKFGPWDLPDKSLHKSKDLEWYFFCPREKKYASGARTKRATEYGYWKTTCKDKSVIYNQRTVGMIKTLVFHKGHAPNGERTNWVMHEYRIEDKNLADVVQEYMLCKVFQKSGPGLKNGAQYGAPFNDEEWSDGEELCSESSPVDGWALYHVLPSNMNSSAAVSLTVPGSSCSHSISKPCPSTAGPSNFDTSNDMADLADEDIRALLDMLAEDSTMIPVENSIAEKFNIANNDTTIEALPCLDGNENEIYNDLEDLNNWAELMDAGFNLSTNQDVGSTQNPMLLGDGSAFLELNDLDIPLRCPAEAGEFELVQTGSTYAPHSSYRNLDGSYCEGNHPSAVQNVSELNQHSALPEGSHWLEDSLEVARKDNGFGNFEAHGVDAFTCNEVPVSCIQPEGNSFAEQIQRRGEHETKPLSRLQLLLESISAQPASAAELPAHLIRAEKLNDSISDCGSSIHFKAEVTLKVGECTKDALSHCLGESTCMCINWGKMPIGDLRKKVTYYCHGLTCIFYFVIISIIWIFMLATVQFFVDTIIVLFFCDNCCFKFLVDQCSSDWAKYSNICHLSLLISRENPVKSLLNMNLVILFSE